MRTQKQEVESEDVVQRRREARWKPLQYAAWGVLFAAVALLFVRAYLPEGSFFENGSIGFPFFKWSSGIGLHVYPVTIAFVALFGGVGLLLGRRRARKLSD